MSFVSDVEDYITEAIEGAATALLWQATDASENGGDGFPITDGNGDDSGREYVDRVIAEVPYLTEAVTAFVRGNYSLLWCAGIDGGQCGHDFILTANGHGAGFWDRGNGAVGELLTERCKGYSFEAEFMLWSGDAGGGGLHCSDEIVWLMVENVVLVDEMGMSS